MVYFLYAARNVYDRSVGSPPPPSPSSDSGGGGGQAGASLFVRRRLSRISIDKSDFFRLSSSPFPRHTPTAAIVVFEPTTRAPVMYKRTCNDDGDALLIFGLVEFFTFFFLLSLL